MLQENREKPWEDAVATDDAHRESGHADREMCCSHGGYWSGSFSSIHPLTQGLFPSVFKRAQSVPADKNKR